jgi:hypothetical protein
MPDRCQWGTSGCHGFPTAFARVMILPMGPQKEDRSGIRRIDGRRTTEFPPTRWDARPLLPGENFLEKNPARRGVFIVSLKSVEEVA